MTRAVVFRAVLRAVLLFAAVSLAALGRGENPIDLTDPPLDKTMILAGRASLRGSEPFTTLVLDAVARPLVRPVSKSYLEVDPEETTTPVALEGPGAEVVLERLRRRPVVVEGFFTEQALGPGRPARFFVERIHYPDPLPPAEPAGDRRR